MAEIHISLLSSSLSPLDFFFCRIGIVSERFSENDDLSIVFSKIASVRTATVRWHLVHTVTMWWLPFSTARPFTSLQLPSSVVVAFIPCPIAI